MGLEPTLRGRLQSDWIYDALTSINQVRLLYECMLSPVVAGARFQKRAITGCLMQSNWQAITGSLDGNNGRWRKMPEANNHWAFFHRNDCPVITRAARHDEEYPPILIRTLTMSPNHEP